MADGGRPKGIERIRQLALSVERLAAEGLSSGAVRGLAEELRAEQPELEGQLRQLVEDLLVVATRAAAQAAQRPGVPPPGAWMENAAGGAVRGMASELRRASPGLGELVGEVLSRLDRLLAQTSEFTTARTARTRSPGERARTVASATVEGALGQLQRGLPALVPLASQLAAGVGQGLLGGIAENVGTRQDAVAQIVERAGRSFVRGVVQQLDVELSRRGSEARVHAVASLAEQTAAATLHGLAAALRKQVEALRAARTGRAAAERLRRSSRDVAEGVLDALSPRLRRPMAIVGAGGALLVAALVLRGRGA